MPDSDGETDFAKPSLQVIEHEGHLALCFQLQRCDLRSALKRWGQGRWLRVCGVFFLHFHQFLLKKRACHNSFLYVNDAFVRTLFSPAPTGAGLPLGLVRNYATWPHEGSPNPHVWAKRVEQNL